MSTRIENESVIVVPPNSETPIKSQRIGIKKSSVCSYYLSGKHDAVLDVFEHLNGRFYLDLSATFFFCQKPINMLLKNCFSFYRNCAKDIGKSLSYIEWIINNFPSDAFVEINPPVFLSSGKYMKLDQVNAKLEAFKGICLGDLVEMVFCHAQKNVFILYARPRADLGNCFESEEAFIQWFKSNKIEL